MHKHATHPWHWLAPKSLEFLHKDGGYVLPSDTAQGRVRAIGDAAEAELGLPGFSDKLVDYTSRGWVSFSSPVWSNFGTNRGLPISCFNSHVGDDMDEIIGKIAEIAKQTQKGGGTSVYLGDLRERGAPISTGGFSEGPAHFAKWFDTTIDVVSQANVRRGQCGAYLPTDHPDIMEFLDLRNEDSSVQKLSLGVCLSDEWIADFKANPEGVHGDIMVRIHEKRAETGYPYFFFTDNANKKAPDVYKALGRKIKSSNLCTEVMLSSVEDESFVCCLSSVNLAYYDDWKDTDLIEVMVYLLDAVLSEFIRKTEGMRFMDAPRNFAIRQRAIGLGVLGFHSYLQSLMLPFGSWEARAKNVEIFSYLQRKSLAASKKMAATYGEPPMLQGYGRRHVTLNAIAPTMSSSVIIGGGVFSPCIEPYESNYFSGDVQKVTYIYQSPYLKEVLASYNMDVEATWDDILLHGGSVQHLEFLTDHEREVFKTAGEISQGDIITLAAQRDNFLDQGQSINLWIHPDTPLNEVNGLVLKAHELGLRSLYYLNGTNAAQEYARGLMTCSVCE